MSNEWKIKRGDINGGQTGQLLDGCEIRQKADGSGYELIAVLAETKGSNLPVNFQPFAYRGFIWRMGIETFDAADKTDQPYGRWSNNAPAGPSQEEGGTWTAQAGSGLEEKGKEDAASASA